MRTFSEDETLVRDRRRQIVLGAMKLFVEQGYSQTNMRQLAKACGVSAGLIYHYVSSKKDVLRLMIEYMESLYQEQRETLDSIIRNLGATEALCVSIKKYMEFADEYQDWIILIDREIINLPKSEQFLMMKAQTNITNFFETLLIRGINTGEFEIDDPGLIAHHITMLRHTWATRRWFVRKRWTLDTYTEAHIKYILKSIQSATAQTT